MLAQRHIEWPEAGPPRCTAKVLHNELRISGGHHPDELARSKAAQTQGQEVRLGQDQEGKLSLIDDFLKLFKLINEETRIQDPIDISYVYNGYSPLSVKFIETFLYSGGFAKIEDSNLST